MIGAVQCLAPRSTKITQALFNPGKPMLKYLAGSGRLQFRSMLRTMATMPQKARVTARPQSSVVTVFQAIDTWVELVTSKICSCTHTEGLINLKGDPRPSIIQAGSNTKQGQCYGNRLGTILPVLK